MARYGLRIIAGLAAAVFVCDTLAQERPDPAAWLPADTLLYVGWNGGADEALLDELETYAGRLVENPLFEVDAEDQLAVKRIVDSAATLLQHPMAVGVIQVDAREAGPEVIVAAVSAVEDDSGRVSRAVRTMLETASGTTAERTTHEGVNYQSVLLEADDNVRALWTVTGGKLVVVGGVGKLEAAATALVTGPTETLAASEGFAQCEQKLGFAGRGHFTIYAPVQAILSRVRSIAEGMEQPLTPEVEQVLEESGLNALQAFAARLSRADEAHAPLQSSAFMPVDGEYKGLLKFWDQAPLTEADLAQVPADAWWATVANLDLHALYEETLRVLGVLSPEVEQQVTGAIAATRQVLGFSITDDLLPALGDTWVLFDGPTQGSFLFTNAVLTVDVREKQTLRDIGVRLLQLGNAGLEEEETSLRVKVETLEVPGVGGAKAVDVEYLAMPGFFMPVAPSVAYVGDRLVLALTPQAIKTALPQLQGRDPATSLLGRADVQAALPLLPKELQSFYYVNNEASVRAWYGLEQLIEITGLSLVEETAAIGEVMTLAEKLETTHIGLVGWGRDADGIVYGGQETLRPGLFTLLPYGAMLAGTVGFEVP